jgi:DNA-directed RNA polymerase specialized sigma24 family protein
VDVDYALGRLSPEQRDVLLARYFDGESAAEIGARYGRTEQTITSWLRRAVAQMRVALAEPRRGGSEAADATVHLPSSRADSALDTRP